MISSYLHRVFDPAKLAKTVEQAANSLWAWEKEFPFDAIAFTGVSGAALAFPLSVRIGKPLICVRKNEIPAHSTQDIEGDSSINSYIIVDDCVDTGATVKTIIRDIKKSWDFSHAELKGVYLYDVDSLWCEMDFYNDIMLIPKDGGIKENPRKFQKTSGGLSWEWGSCR